MDDDPGWGSPAKILLGMVVPRLAVHRAQAAGANPLLAIRTAFVSFVSSIVLFGVVLPFVVGGGEKGDPQLDPTLAIAGVAALGLLMLALPSVIARRLTCGSVEELVGSYRTRFFLRVAFTDSAALFGFVASFLAESIVPYFVGAAIALLGFARLAPTRSHLLRDRDELRNQGCPHDLYALLQGVPPGPG